MASPSATLVLLLRALLGVADMTTTPLRYPRDDLIGHSHCHSQLPRRQRL